MKKVYEEKDIKRLISIEEGVAPEFISRNCDSGDYVVKLDGHREDDD